MKIQLNEASAELNDFNQDDDLSDKVKVLTSLYVNPSSRGNGQAKALIDKITNDADLNGHAIILEPKPYGESSLDRNKLISLYAKHGFVRLQKEPYLMVRYPQTPKATLKKTHYETQLAVKSIGA